MKYIDELYNTIINNMPCNKSLRSGFTHKMFAYLICDGKFIISAENSFNVVPGKNKCAHAEHNLMSKIKRKLSIMKLNRKKFDILILKFTPNGLLGQNSKPCFNCINTFKDSKINKVYYLVDNKLICNKFNDLLYEQDKHIPKSFRYRFKHNDRKKKIII